MGLTVFDTADMPPEHRFEAWRETVIRGAGPTSVTAARPAEFAGRMEILPLGTVRLATATFPAMSTERGDRLIRRSDPETYELTLVLGGSMRMAQADGEAQLSTGDFNLWSSSLPYRSASAAGPAYGDPAYGSPAYGERVDRGEARAVILHLPRALVPLPEARVHALLARGLPSTSGFGAILARHLTTVAEQAAHLDDGGAERLGAVTSDLATAFLAHHLDATDRLPPRTRHQMLLSRIDTFIADNLTDPGLSPQVIAARHHISVRLLHRLFAAREASVASTIRRLRLERASTDLRDPRLSALPVHAVGARWGFADGAAFSRSFRATYGISPRDHRHRPPTPTPTRTGPDRTR
ncbi:helix-turn-helix domain-containing protein [Streptomyces sp. NPDC090077]|uniref:AraC-like ligand-binding domain-containing protein n=1 Tax=Streptomyces sp. NPDC090077 TaxID=3365938 RepID=UPI0037F685EE